MRFVSFTRSIAGFSFALFLLSAFALLILMGGVVTVASAQTGESSTPSAKATKKAKALTVSPKKLNFGELAPLKPSAPATVTIHNPNSIAIEISSIDPQDPEFVPSGNCVRSLAADGNCAVSIVFTASSNGKKSAKLTIVNGASSKSLSVSMTGEGIGTPMPSPTATATATPTATPTATASSDPTATGSATPTATATPVSGAIVLPIEVIGPQGETGTRSFTLTSAQANSAVTFWLQGNHLGYVPSLQKLPPGKASISLNGGPWLALTNETVTVLPPGANYEGIDGGLFDTVKVTIPISTLGSVVAGTNTVSFRMNQTDGVTTGFRIIAFNLLASDGSQIMPADQFANDDPSLWTAPLNDSADISAGQTLWHTATLAQSSLTTSTIKAHCADCHAQDGRDLKYFNYSNYSIIQRSQFHGLSQLQGEQIASYIRSGIPNAPAFSSYARPWNPPYQPGPGLNSHSIADWSAGAGIQWVLDDDTQTLNYIFPNGYTPAAIPATGAIDKREIPVFLPMPSWNQWLPTVSPMDAYTASTLTAMGASATSWAGSGVASRYNGMRSNLTSNLTQYITNPTKGVGGSGSSFASDLETWDFADRQSLGINPNAPWTPILSNYAYALSRWQLTKVWEMMHEFNLEGQLSQSEGYNLTMPTDDRVWNAAEPFMSALFRIGIPTEPNGEQPYYNASDNNFYGDQLKDTYFTSAWYYVQILLHSGQRQRGGNSPIDWGYYLNHMGNESSLNGHLGYAGLMTMVWLNAQQEDTTTANAGSRVHNSSGYLLDPDYGFNPAWGSALDNLVFPQYFGYGAPGPWANLSPANAGQLVGTLSMAWLNEASTWTPAQWDSVKNDDGTAFGSPSLVCTTGQYDGTAAGNRTYTAISEFQSSPYDNDDVSGNVLTADMTALATWATTIWLACNWSQF